MIDGPALIDVSQELLVYADDVRQQRVDTDFDAWLRLRYRECTVEFEGYEQLAESVTAILPGGDGELPSPQDWSLVDTCMGSPYPRTASVALSTRTSFAYDIHRRAVRIAVAQFAANAAYTLSYEKVCAAAGF